MRESALNAAKIMLVWLSLSWIFFAPSQAAAKGFSFWNASVLPGQEAYIKTSISNFPASHYPDMRFGYALSVDGDTLAVGAYQEPSSSSGINGDQYLNDAWGAGAVYVFTRSGSTWTQQAYLKASNNEYGNDEFGISLSLSGDTLAVGAHYEESMATGINGDQMENSYWGAGAVYVFTRSGTTWSQQAYVKASNSGDSDYFGRAVSLSGDTLAVGAQGEDSNAIGINGNQADDSAASSGAVYVFARSGTVWSQQAYIKASNANVGDLFGTAVSVDGDTLAVGAKGEDSNATGINGNQADDSAASSGAVYVFARSGTVWSQQAYIKASNTDANDQFGYAVDVSGDTLAVTAPYEDSNATVIDGNGADNTASSAGAAYVFKRTGAVWAQEAYIKASNAQSNDYLGHSVSVNSDTLAVGADSEYSNATGINGNQTDNSAPGSGAVYVFTRSGAVWTQQAYVKASNTNASDRFGFAVDVSGDTLAVGAHYEDSIATGINGNQTDNSVDDAGAAYVFTRSGTVWTQQAYVKSSNTTFIGPYYPQYRLGWALAISNDTLVVSAPGDDSNATGINGNQANNSMVYSGAVYVFVRSGTVWSQQAYIKASTSEAYDSFGESIALDGNTLVVGAIGEDSNAVGVGGTQSNNSAVSSGAVYVFTRTGSVWSQQAYVKASNTQSSDNFGYSVTISGDTIAVGARYEDSNGTGVNSATQANNSASASGAVYVFTRSGAVWSQQAYIKASNTGADDYFGSSVSVWGDTLAVGAHLEDSSATGINGANNNLASQSGAVYVFTRSGSTWSQQAYVKASNASADDLFGYSVSVWGDTLAVGATHEDSDATGVNGANNDLATDSGAVYVFTRSGSTWTQEAYLKASNTGVNDSFGYRVSLWNHTLAVSAHQEDSAAVGLNGNGADNSMSSSGAVYVFKRNGTQWSQKYYVKPSNTVAGAQFGQSVGVFESTLAAGAFFESGGGTGVNGSQTGYALSSGAAYVFRF